MDQFYKLKDVKVYSSTEWLANNKKKYRQVFDRYETDYVYCELSIFNRRFLEEDWQVDIQLKCFQIKKTKKEICNLNFMKKISKFDHTAYIREGWGAKNAGSIFKKGTYYWEVFIEGKKIGTKYFYVEDSGIKLPEWYPKDKYLSIRNLRLFEGSDNYNDENERIYLKEFDFKSTRYIYVDIDFINENKGKKKWQLELFFNFFNEARELKGKVKKLYSVDSGQKEFNIIAGWGSNVVSSWRKGGYSCEIVYRDKLLAVVPFKVGKKNIAGDNEIHIPDLVGSGSFLPINELITTFDGLMENLENMIGLHDIKKQVKDHARYIQFLKLRKNKGFNEDKNFNIHLVFTGNPGTGKTTVAEMIGKLYQKMGLLSRGHVHTVDRSNLIGEYIGQTAPKVVSAIDQARGGVLFIDEAYSLSREKSDNKDFGREVIELLVREMSNGKGDLVVIAAGYPDEMENFMNSNPGLKSRFNHIFHFEDYLPQELVEIAVYASDKFEVELHEDALLKVKEIIIDAYRNRNKTFGNARFVYDLIEKAKIQLGLRAMSQGNPLDLNKDYLKMILSEDIEKINVDKKKPIPEIPIDESLLDEAIDELHSLVGMEEIKNQITELIELVRFYKKSDRDVLNAFYLHTVLVGNPGTGKTTVAHILAKIYRALGMLERGHLVETDQQGLVAGYVGQTAIKTSKKIDEAKGGVLLIDEAYSLSRSGMGERGSFGDEAIQTLLKRMEDERGLFFVFVTGYPAYMSSFLKANPGLNSRFDKVLHFKDYSPEELMSIAINMVSEHNFILEKKATILLRKHLNNLYLKRDRFFGNARIVRQIVDQMIKNQNLRLSQLDWSSFDSTESMLIKAEDVANLDIIDNHKAFDKKYIGFKISEKRSSQGDR